MLRSVSLTALLLATTTPAFAQRTGENAVASAQDAFGTSVGNERVGLYSPFSARGFSPVQAGNVRINGMYFDYQADLNQRLISGSNVRVGLTAQGYPFPAPTGVADFSLRLPGSEAVASTVVGIGPFGGPRVEVDAQLPSPRRSGSPPASASTSRSSYHGGDQRLLSAAARRALAPGGECRDHPLLEHAGGATAGRRSRSSSPPAPSSRREIERRRYFGPEWARERGPGRQLRAPRHLQLRRLDAARRRLPLDRARLYATSRPCSSTRRPRARPTASSSPIRRAASPPPRASCASPGKLIEGDRLHQFHLMTRGRMQDRRYGGGQRFDFGRGRIDEPIDRAGAGLRRSGPQTTDEVRQLTFGPRL